MKNFKVIDRATGKGFWISRSVAVAIIVYYKDYYNTPYILLEKRGKGCPDFVDNWCLPCGYVDWGETIEEAAAREIYEEVGLTLNSYDFKIISIQSNPEDNKNQNITIRLAIEVRPSDIINALTSGRMNNNTASRGGEPDEVECFELVPINAIKKYDFAWNHDKVILNWYENS